MSVHPTTRRRIVLCMGPYCNQGGQAEPLYNALAAVLGEPCPAFMARDPLHWETANCLSMCGAGPNLIIYPDETVLHHLDPGMLRAVIERLQADTSGG